MTPLLVTALILGLALISILTFASEPALYLNFIFLGLFDMLITLAFLQVYGSRMIGVMERLEDMAKPLKEAKVRLVANSQYHTPEEASEAKNTTRILSSLIEDFSNSTIKLRVLGIKVTAIKLNSFLATCVIALTYLVQAVVQVSPITSTVAPTMAPTSSPTALPTISPTSFPTTFPTNLTGP